MRSRILVGYFKHFGDDGAGSAGKSDADGPVAFTAEIGEPADVVFLLNLTNRRLSGTPLIFGGMVGSAFGISHCRRPKP